MDQMEQVELLRAAIALAVADGKVRRSEKGVVEGLALRVGVGQASLEAMFEAAEQDDSIADNLLIKDKTTAHMAFELLVAQARIDGEISLKERELLIRIASSLGIDDGDFPVIYQAGLQRADTLRQSRKGSS